MTAPSVVAKQMQLMCKDLRLPTIGTEAVGRFVDAGHVDALPTLLEVFRQEMDDRYQRRVDRLRKSSRLPPGKTWDNFEQQKLPPPLRAQLQDLLEGQFLDRAVNVLAFGLPGTGKTHALCAIGHKLVESGRRVPRCGVTKPSSTFRGSAAATLQSCSCRQGRQMVAGACWGSFESLAVTATAGKASIILPVATMARSWSYGLPWVRRPAPARNGSHSGSPGRVCWESRPNSTLVILI